MIRTAQRVNARRQQVAELKAVPAPVGGWNARDALADMPATDAIRLENWFPQTTSVIMRGGASSHATGLDAQVESLMVYTNASTSKLFAASGTEIHDVTAAGAVGAAVVSALSNARFQHTLFRTSAGAYLICVNGADEPRRYDGSAWTATHGISGVGLTTTTLVHVTSWKTFLWFVQITSTSAWYLPAGTISGTAVEFPLAATFKRGGYLNAIAAVAHDAGDGIDDYWVAVSSEGELVVYKGTDPAAAATFARVGTFEVGKPNGRRCFVQYGGDLIYISKDGFHSVAALLQYGRGNNKASIADKIRNAVTSASVTYSSSFGWQATLFSEKNALIFNVPAGTTTWHQYVMNTITGAWCKFTNWNANCFAVFNGNLYYGGNLIVHAAWTGTADAGSNIVADGKTAFSDFDAPGRIKHIEMASAHLIVSGSLGVTFGANFDYEDIPVDGLIGVAGPTSGVWDTGTWDQSIWGGTAINNEWVTIGGEGTEVAGVVVIRTKTITVEWAQTKYLYRVGGPL